MSYFFKILTLPVLVLLLFSGLLCEAQWLNGYRYRKKITINQDKVEPLPGATAPRYIENFYVLVQLEDPGLKYHTDAFENKISHPQGLDISFTSAESLTTPLKFQLESYDPVRGKLVCWVLLPQLATRNGASSTFIYFYYGSAVLHQPNHPDVERMWDAAYHHVQHLNDGAEGMIGSGRVFNGISDVKFIKAHSNIEYALSAWIKFKETGTEQMIISNDSLGLGYQLKVTPENRIRFIIRGSKLLDFTGLPVLKANEWHFISLAFKDGLPVFLIDGAQQNPSGNPTFTISLAGQVAIGASKQGDQFFNGTIDDLKIGKVLKMRPWLATEYTNQSNPAGFVTVGAEEVTTLMPPYAYTFLGSSDNIYTKATNWDVRGVPTADHNIKIKAGKTAAISTDVVVNRLKLEAGAKIELTGNLKVLQNLTLEGGASIISNTSVSLQLEGGVVNDGSITLNGLTSKLVFAGNTAVLNYSGLGSASVSRLEVDRPASQSVMTLAAPLEVSKSIKLINGELNANGKLVMLSSNGVTAALYPVPNSASISGNVQVQLLINGTFPSPASGRGWRLLSSPVVHNTVAANHEYQLQSLKNALFITGKGGPANGFDTSPNNGATIYTHDQSLPGSLAQKYVPIANMQTNIPVGKGFFLYSRGDRNLPDAYRQQVQSPPFSNPASYILTYTGRLFTGDLVVNVFNNDNGEEGDGFNLLGNPYAAPIKWGSLIKTNIADHVWLFDPVNNAYRTIIDAEELIPPGAGFFIRVKQGATSGSVVFSENSKSVL